MPESLSTTYRREEIPQEILDLRRRLEVLPKALREDLLPLCEKVTKLSRMQSRLVQIAQDVVDQLQLDNKYLLFDLEATRRERDDYRRQLEEG
jgi:hypothetical protein